jgi:hypothetical protein
MTTAKPATESRHINGVDVERLSATVESVQATPAIARFQFRVSNQWIGGIQNRGTAKAFYGAGEERDHPAPFAIPTDEPEVLPGRGNSL